jgi:hypothetical protein
LCRKNKENSAQPDAVRDIVKIVFTTIQVKRRGVVADMERRSAVMSLIVAIAGCAE